MKKLFFFISLLSIIGLTSCNLGSGDSDYSPQLSIYSVSINGTTVTQVDTLTVGDVVDITAIASGVSKPLTSVQITNETEYATISFPDISALDASVLSISNPENGLFNFSGLNIYSFTFVVRYVVTKANKDGAKLTFVVKSTSQYSPGTSVIKLPAKAAAN